MLQNFNYIAFGNRDYVDGAVDTIEMDRGRMFEYTPTDMEKRLESLDVNSIGFLEKLPTFLVSEISRNGNSASMIIKFGKVRDIVPKRKEVSARFETLIDFRVVEFSSLNEAQEVFSSDGLQLYRTHWAVRDGDANLILNKLKDLKPELANEVAGRPQSDLAAEPPPRTKNTIGIADSVGGFLQLLYNSPAKDSTETFFRGHEDAKFELTPSLLRKWPDGVWKYMPNEDRLCKELLIAHYDEFQGDQYCFDRLVRMQHYGLPTRLLDVSGNPLVALFFACYGSSGLHNTDGEVIVFNVSSDSVKYYDSDTVSCVANLSNLTYSQKNEIDIKLDIEAFNTTVVAGKLLHHIKSEKVFFLGRIVPDDLGSILCVKAKRTNMRIKSQFGAFLLFGHEAVLPESGQKNMEISRVTITKKQDILDQLKTLNI